MSAEAITVAVLMPAYNPSAKELQDSLSSLVDQGILFRVVVVDDGSRQPVESMLPEIDFPLTCLRLDKNSGIVGALNAGLAHILEDPDIRFIARLDVADMMRPERLARQAAYLNERPRMGLCGTDTICFFEDGAHHSDYQPGDDPRELTRMLKFTNPLTHSAVMIKRHVLQEFGVYREGFPAAEDYELWRRIAQRYEIGNVPEFLTVYMVQPAGISLSNPIRQLRGRLAVQWAYFSPADFGDIRGILRTLAMLALPVPILNRIKIAIRGYV